MLKRLENFSLWYGLNSKLNVIENILKTTILKVKTNITLKLSYDPRSVVEMLLVLLEKLPILCLN